MNKVPYWLEITLSGSTSNRIESGVALTVMLSAENPELSWEVGEITELTRVVFPLSTLDCYFGAIAGVRADLPPPITPNVLTLLASSIVPVDDIKRLAISVS